MTCDELRPELIPFHCGEVSGETRRRLEAHLPGCATCVTELLALKRAFEAAEDDEPRPSDVARARLRAAVAKEIGAAPRRWWERPVAFTFAASAVIAAVFAMRSLTSGPGAPPLGASEGAGAAVTRPGP
jgi:anti-sigma factor RsiW